MLDYTAYLAENILSDGMIVTYRSLSRAMKVHSNLAKRMLFDFYQQQASKQPLCAIYLISGLQEIQAGPRLNGYANDNGNDDHIPSSPFMSSSIPQHIEERRSLSKVITLVGEDHLDAVKARYQEITSMHIYSLQPGSIQNLQILSDTTHKIAIQYACDDPLEAGKQYGVIQNPRVKRRVGTRPVAAVIISDVANAGDARIEAKSAANEKEEPLSASIESEVHSWPVAKQERGREPIKKASNKASVMQREQSDIFKSFGKTKARINREDTGSSLEGAPGSVISKLEEALGMEVDAIMNGASEVEQEDDFIFESKNEATVQRSIRLEREEKLRKMMDEEDEPMEDATDESPTEASDPQPIHAAASPHVSVTTITEKLSGGRRRGRRRVMKKRIIKDEENYLVTKEEAVWESFSEDDVAIVPKTEKIVPSVSSFVGIGKKTTEKAGQGNIMSFFGKK